MSIASAIANKQQQIADAYTAISNKGGTLPATQNLSNMPTAIASIPTGSAPVISSLNVTPSTSAQTITAPSGTDGYSPINVSAVTSSIDANITAGNIKSGVSILGVTGTYSGGGTGIPREVGNNGVYKIPTTSFVFTLPSNATNLGQFALYYAFHQSSGITSADLSSLTTLTNKNSLSYTFDYSSLTSIDLSNLTMVSGTDVMSRMCYGSSSLTSVDLSSLESVQGSNSMNYAFRECRITGALNLSSLKFISGSSGLNSCFAMNKNITSVNLSALKYVVQDSLNYAFYDNNITSVDLSSLEYIQGYSCMYQTFRKNPNLTSILFPKLERIGSSSLSASDYGQMALCFYDTGITSLTFPELKEIYCTGSNSNLGTFDSNSTIQKFYFPKLDTITYGTNASASNQNACKNIFKNCSALTEIHFGAANQTAIEATAGYSTLWGRGAGNATVYFDL